MQIGGVGGVGSGGREGVQSKINNRMANNADPDEMAHYYCLIWIYTVCTFISFGLPG